MAAALPVLVNASAGSVDHEPEVLRGRFRSLGVEADVRIARDGAHLKALAEEAARAKPPAIVVGGGDGTLSTVASVIAHSEIALGVLPLGTLNLSPATSAFPRTWMAQRA